MPMAYSRVPCPCICAGNAKFACQKSSPRSVAAGATFACDLVVDPFAVVATTVVVCVHAHTVPLPVYPVTLRGNARDRGQKDMPGGDVTPKVLSDFNDQA